MIGALRRLASDTRASSAVEMALVTPFLLVLVCSFVEAGNFVMNEHGLVKAVRDGARFAARQDFSNYTGCSGQPGGTVVTDTQEVVIHGYRSGGTGYLTPNIAAANITVATSCALNAGGQTMQGGIYGARANGGQIVTVSASVPYRFMIGAFGFTGAGFNLNAASQAAVTGL
jgi:Flp pilus assembly protein TadG